MNIAPSKTEFSDDEHRSIRMEVERSKSPPEALTEAQIARESGVAASTLNSYLKGSYRGDDNSPAAQLHKWLQARRRSQEFRIRLPVAPSYQPIGTSQQIMGLLSYALGLGRIVMIAGVPGSSKTAACRQFASETPRTFYACMDTTTAGVSTMLAEILRMMGEPDAKGTPQLLFNRVSARLEEARSLLIVDEANHLGDKSIEALRALNDRARTRGVSVGVALVGNEIAYRNVGTAGGKAAFAQVSSRVGMRRFLLSPPPAEVAIVAQAWAAANDEIIGPGEVKFLQQIAAKPGGLRNVETTMEAAIMACRGGQEPLELAHLKAAFDELAGHNSSAA